jgi:hypothetical protein
VAAPSAEAAFLKVDTMGDGGDGNCTPGSCTLRDAVTNANTYPDLDTITFASTITGEVTLQSQIPISGPIDIRGPGRDVLTLSGDSNQDGTHDFATAGDEGDTRIFGIGGNQFQADLDDVRISRLTLSDGVASGWASDPYGYSGPYYVSGGAIASGNVDLTLTNITVQNSRATSRGGGISHGLGTLTLENAEITGNRSAAGGGGLSFRPYSDSLPEGEYAGTITGTTFRGNSSTGSQGGVTSYLDAGGGLYAVGSVLVEDTAFIDNRTSGQGGGAWLSGATTIRDSRFSGNIAASNGGGADLLGATVSRSKFIRNRSRRGGGGGLAINAGELHSSIVSGNSALRGGGIDIEFNGYLNPEEIHISNSTISGNRAWRGEAPQVEGEGSGGGIFVGEEVYDFGELAATITNSTVASNESAEPGAGLLVRASAKIPSPLVRLSSSIVADNVTRRGRRSDIKQSRGGLIATAFSLIEAKGRRALRGLRRGSNIFGRDPMLLPLADNGGRTRTHKLRRRSPAVDAGVANGLRRDQRGARRTFNTRRRNARRSDGTDMGAFERRR